MIYIIKLIYLFTMYTHNCNMFTHDSFDMDALGF